MDDHAREIAPPLNLAAVAETASPGCVDLPTKGLPDAGTLCPHSALTDTRHLNIKPAADLVEGIDMLGDAIYVASDFPVAYQASQNSQQRSERVVMTYQERATERVSERAEPRPFNPEEIDRGFVQHGMCF